MSDSVRPHRRQPTRLPCPWDSPGKNTGLGCHFLLQCMEVKSESEVAQLCLTLCDPMDYSPPGSCVHGIFQARVLEWGAITFSEKVRSEGKKDSGVPSLKVHLSSSAQSCPTLCDPMAAAYQASLSITNFRSLLKLMSMESVMPTHPLSSPSPAFNLSQHQGLFR